MNRNIINCNNVSDLRLLAKKKLPKPVFDYIDGAADDEVTYLRNTEAFKSCDLIPNVLHNIENIDMSVNVLGSKLDMPIFCSPTALQRIFHADGEKAVAKAANKYGTMFGVSSLGTISLSDISKITNGPKLFQFYYHKDKNINSFLLDSAKQNGFNALALTVDTAVGGNRERDLRSGFTIPLKLNYKSLISFLIHPSWSYNYIFGKKVELPELKKFIIEGSNLSMSVSKYFSEMLDSSLSWKDAEDLANKWGANFCLKGIMSKNDALKAIDIGATAIMVSNHGGRQLDGSRSPFDQLREIVEAVDGRIEVILDGGIRRGTHVLKAIAAGATACSGGRMYLYGLAAAGQIGVEKALDNIKCEIERDMKLMGVTNLSQLNQDMLRYR